MALDSKDKIIDLPNERVSPLSSLLVFVRSLFKIWWIFLIVGVTAGVAGIIYAGLQQPSYKSRLTFALDDGNGSGVGNFINLASQFGINFGGGKDIFAGDNILDIMKSRRMLERVFLSVDTFNNRPFTLIEYYLEISNQRKSSQKIENIHFPPEQVRSTFTYKQDSILYVTYMAFSKNHLKAERPDRKLSIFEVNVTSPDEKFTKDFTDRIVNETNNFYIEIRTKKAKETLDVLEERVSNMKANLNSSIQKKANVQDVNVNPAFSGADVPVIKQQANIQVYGTAYSELFKNLELARFQYLNEIPLMQVIDTADYPMEKLKLSKLNTGIIFSVVSCLLLLVLLWLLRVYKLSRMSGMQIK
ncbi:MAG: Wzz/FepE/Etk N-terminal domain-containing protein [Ginsengibacter sp.]